MNIDEGLKLKTRRNLSIGHIKDITIESKARLLDGVNNTGFELHMIHEMNKHFKLIKTLFEDENLTKDDIIYFMVRYDDNTVFNTLALYEFQHRTSSCIYARSYINAKKDEKNNIYLELRFLGMLYNLYLFKKEYFEKGEINNVS